MNAEFDSEFIGENWDFPECGRKMNPHGDCIPCEKKERARAEAAGERKRAKNIVVGDVICTPFGHIKVTTINVKTVEITPKAKVIVNKGMGYRDGEIIFHADQWGDMSQKPAILVGMKTIEQHNAERAEAYERLERDKFKTGLLCPRCNDGTELLKVDPNSLLSSMPPQMAVHCAKCDYNTFVLA